jgi:hypothetical protein
LQKKKTIKHKKGFFPGCRNWKCISNSWDHPKFQRFRLLAGLFIFRVVLVAADIGSDIATAVEFAAKGDFYWGLLTGFLIITPFLAKCIFYFASLKRCFEVKWSKHCCRIPQIKPHAAKLSFWLQELKQIWWHFPLLLPFRCVLYLT